jgi:hypothetical protein
MLTVYYTKIYVICQVYFADFIKIDLDTAMSMLANTYLLIKQAVAKFIPLAFSDFFCEFLHLGGR